VAYREQAGLDLEQASEEMHLSSNIIHALENEDFAHLPEPPYVRGYLRSYARLANADSKELIRIYEFLRGGKPDEIAHHFAPAKPLNRVAQQPALSSTTLKFIGLGASVLLLGLLSMIPGIRDWASNTWTSFSAQTNPPEMPRPPSAMETFAAQKAAEEKAASEAIATANNAPVTPEPGTPPEVQAATVAPKTSAASTVATPVPLATTGSSIQDTATSQTTPTTLVTTGDTPDVTKTGDTPIAGIAPDGNQAAAVATTATADASTITTAAATPIEGEVSVKLEFTQDVWMQVKDEAKKTLFESTNTAGTTKEFKAVTPLNFKVGNAPGVKVYLNGQLYDQTPYTKGSVARFKVE
jgi:cytoskeletal protein RodZ